MKKIFLIVFSGVAMVLACCGKKYTCECTLTYSDQGQSLISENDQAEYSERMTRKQAEAACASEQESLQTTSENLNTNNNTFSTTATVHAECELD